MDEKVEAALSGGEQVIFLRIAVLGVLFGLGVATGMTVEFCGWKSLLPKNFNAYGFCDATDPPLEVFASFVVWATLIGTILASVSMAILWWIDRDARLNSFSKGNSKYD